MSVLVQVVAWTDHLQNDLPVKCRVKLLTCLVSIFFTLASDFVGCCDAQAWWREEGLCTATCWLRCSRCGKQGLLG